MISNHSLRAFRMVYGFPMKHAGLEAVNTGQAFGIILVSKAKTQFCEKNTTDMKGGKLNVVVPLCIL